MLDTVEIAKKIKTCAKNKGIRLCDMLKDLGMSVNAISNLSAGSGMSYLDLGVNAISQLSAGKEMSFITFAKIADYLGVSVDYLLGREGELLPASEQEWLSVLNQMSDEDLKKMESYAAFLVSEKEKEPPASSGE